MQGNGEIRKKAPDFFRWLSELLAIRWHFLHVTSMVTKVKLSYFVHRDPVIIAIPNPPPQHPFSVTSEELHIILRKSGWIPHMYESDKETTDAFIRGLAQALNLGNSETAGVFCDISSY